MLESSFEKCYEIAPLYTDCFGNLKLSAALHFAQDVAGGHCKLLGLDWDTLAKKQMFWAVIRHRLQITRLPRVGERITLQTWPMPTTKVAFPRSTVAYDAQGKELFRSISLWVLMDSQTRGMILPAKSGVLVPGVMRGDELPVPRTLAPQELASSHTRTVCYTDLDENNHMNNTRYLDWVADLLPSQFYGQHRACEVLICYANEAREGQTLAMQWGMNPEGVLTVDAHRKTSEDSQNQERVFSAQVAFL